MIKLLHASTPKHFATRLAIYETFDEYILSVKKLVSVIRKKSNIELIIRYRDNSFCDFKTFQNILNFNEKNIIIKNDNNLLKDLKSCNLLISYSSTIIEKALYLNKPVALYSIANRFNYFDFNYKKTDPVIKLNYKYLERDINNFIKTKRKYNFNKFIYEGKRYNFHSFIKYILFEVAN